MNYGCLQFSSNSEEKTEFFSGLNDLLDWDITNWFEFKFENPAFQIRSIAKKDLLKKEKDFWYTDQKEEAVILFDGVIYNRQELICEYFPENTFYENPELVFHLFIKFGDCFAEKLNGDFVINIFLPQKNEAVFYCDHLGIRPNAITMLETSLFFGTDPMGLCKVLFKEKEIHREFLINAFFENQKKNDSLPSLRVVKVKPGHFLKVAPEGISQNKYWFPEKIRQDNRLTQGQVLEDLAKLVSNAAEIRSDKRHTASAHVSGGLDSGIVAALARTQYSHQDNFFGYSWSPSNENETVSFDERNLVKTFSFKQDITPFFPRLTLDDYIEFVQDWWHPSEQVFEHQILEHAKAHGISLIFSGWGGDEFISIGNRGIDADLIRGWDWCWFLKKYPLKRPKRFLSALFHALFPGFMWRKTERKTDPVIFSYVKEVLGSNYIPHKKRFKYHSRRLVHLQLLYLGHLSKRANDWYVKGQRFGVEYRYPLLDKRIIEYILKVPSRCLVGGNNYRILLREIGKDIFTPEMLENKSKDDPVKSHYFSEIIKKVEQDFINEFETFRNNPDLSFVDFDLLEKNLPKIRAGKMDASIFYYLKAAHEFTKGYYGKD